MSDEDSARESELRTDSRVPSVMARSRRFADSVLIGTPGPVLPAPARLMPIWLKARASGARPRDAIAALRRLVPPDYTLTGQSLGGGHGTVTP